MARITQREILLTLINEFEPSIARAFIEAIETITSETHIQSLIDRIIIGDLNGAVNVIGVNDASLRPLIRAIEDAYERGGIMNGQTFPKWLNTPSGRVVFRFDIRNSRAEEFLRNSSSLLITRITDDVRENIRMELEQGLRDGRNPRSVALDLVGRMDRRSGRRTGGLIGLTTQQAGWVNNVRADLENLNPRYFTRDLRDKRFDKTVRKAIERGIPLDEQTIAKLTGRYADRALKYRGDTIARKEAIQSLNHASWESVKQAVELGAMRAGDVLREWDDAGDKRVRHSHEQMDGQRVRLYQAFVTPDGDRLMYPGDDSLGAPADEIIGCRCIVNHIVDWFAQGEAVPL